MKEFECVHCKKKFKAKESSNRKYCSKECEGNARKCVSAIWNCKEKILVTCKMCGKQEKVNPSRAKNYKTCSVKCMGLYNKKRYSSNAKKKCIVCGKEFIDDKSKKVRKTCSNKCRAKLRISSIKTNSNNLIDYQKYRKYVEYLLNIKLPINIQVHHKDTDHHNIDESNLILIKSDDHTMFHNILGRAPLKAYYDNIISLEQLLYGVEEQYLEKFKFFLTTNLRESASVVLKQGELLETPEVDNQQPSYDSNIIEGSETNNRIL